MKRGDVVTVAAAGDYGKPRPAVIVQTDALPETHASVVICQMTSEIVDAPDFRVTIDPTKINGLLVRSQLMADKPVTVRRRRIRHRTLSEIIANPDVGTQNSEAIEILGENVGG